MISDYKKHSILRPIEISITKKSIGQNVFYSITENGMTMLNLFMQKHD